jgi:hypothetical protein
MWTHPFWHPLASRFLYFWWTFLPSLVPIGPVVSERIQMWKFIDDDDGRTMMTFGPGELNIFWHLVKVKTLKIQRFCTFANTCLGKISLKLLKLLSDMWRNVCFVCDEQSHNSATSKVNIEKIERDQTSINPNTVSNFMKFGQGKFELSLEVWLGSGLP